MPEIPTETPATPNLDRLLELKQANATEQLAELLDWLTENYVLARYYYHRPQVTEFPNSKPDLQPECYGDPKCPYWDFDQDAQDAGKENRYHATRPRLEPAPWSNSRILHQYFGLDEAALDRERSIILKQVQANLAQAATE